MRYLISITVALALTELVECLIIIIWQNEKRAIPAVLLCNLITNPAVNGIMLLLNDYFKVDSVTYFISLGMLEVVTVFAEALLLMKLLKYTTKKSLKTSIIVNLTSFLFGLSLMLI